MSWRSGPNRKSVASQNSQFAKPGPGLWASRVNFARMEFSEVRPPWVFAAHTAQYLAGRPTSGYRGRLACLAKVVGKSSQMRRAERAPREALYRAEMLKWRIEGGGLRPRRPRRSLARRR
jgi:hypothetical protein